MPLPFQRRGGAQLRPTFSRDFAGLKTLDHGVGPAITFTRASNATYFDVNGVLQTASNDAPRFDHDPATGASRGLLIEESRTNSLTYSADFGDAAWTKIRATITTNTETAPDGTSAADTMTGSSTSSGAWARQDLSMTTGVSYALTCFIKAGTATTARLNIFENSLDKFAIFDLASPSVTSQANTTATSITSVGNGWFRCSITIAAGATGTAQCQIRFGAGTLTATDTLFIWGAQLEAGAFPTSYIPTTTAAATRSADSAVVTPISSFYNQAEGTLFAEFSRYQTAGIADFLQFSGTSPSQIVLETNGTAPSTAQRFLIETGSGAQANISFSGVAANTTYRLVGGYALNSFQAAQNGTLGTEDTSGSLPTVDQMVIGAGRYGTGTLFKVLNGHIRKIAYYPKRLSNTLLQQLTT